MDELLRSITNANIAKFMDILCDSNEVRDQMKYWELLIRQVDRLARDEERQQALQQCLLKCNDHISRQERVIHRLTYLGADTATAEDLLNLLLNMRESLRVQIQVRSTAA